MGMGVEGPHQRWVALTAALWMECMAGASYAFSIYSDDVRRRLGLTQSAVENVSFFKDLGECLGITAGLAYQTWGPRTSLAIGLLLNSAGYFLFWLTLLPSPSPSALPWPALWQLCLGISLAANAQLFFSTSAIVTCVVNFPEQRGLVIGILKGCIGLSPAVLATLWRALLPATQESSSAASSSSSFILMLALLPSLVALLVMPLMKKADPHEASNDDDATTRFAWICVPVVCLALLVLGTDAFAAVSGSSVTASAPFRRLMGVLLVAALMCPVKAFLRTTPAAPADDDDTEKQAATAARHPLLEKEEEERKRAKEKGKVGGTSLWDALMSKEMGILMGSSAMLLGSGSVAINNVGQVGATLRYDQNTMRAVVSMMSVAQFGGRFGAGAASDAAAELRLPALAAVSACMAASNVVVATGALAVGGVMVGLSFGAAYSLVPAVTSELFGLQRFAATFNVLIMANPLVSYVMSVWVAGSLADSSSVGDDDGWFPVTFGIMAGMCLLASLGYLWLFCITRGPPQHKPELSPPALT